jgi:ubiquinone/menaquinone biosynthesis C-methylase UbiE
MLHSRWFLDDEKERREWQNPEEILLNIGLRPGFIFIDMGCGDGFFALPAARLVGEDGKVCGLDADGEAIARLKKRAGKEGLTNLVLKVGWAEDTVFCDGCADIVFFGIVLHDFRSVARVLSNAKRMLKHDGRLVDLDWKKEDMEFGPPLRIRLSEDQAAGLIRAAGFKIEKISVAGSYHYLVIAHP